ncbi:MAG: GPW/gp25 family protein [Rhodobacter sp.]|nr:GPW/gp25 family protein [Rhodobacter sp.]
MTGLSRHTARPLSDLDAHLAQSIDDILTTPVGSRVMRRDYGSDLHELIDAPLNGETVVDLYMATAVALEKWEPRLQLNRVQVAAAEPGRIALDLEGELDRTSVVLSVGIGGAP